MLVQDKHIAIVGGGPGGLTLAKLLQQQGAHVTVYERDKDKNARVQGSPLDLHEDSGLAALKQAGLMEAFKSHFMPMADRKKIMDEKANVYFNDHNTKPEENFGHAHFRPEISRGALRKILLESLEPGTVVWDSHFISLSKQQEGWWLHFKDGTSVHADMVIAADGANSKIRPYLTHIQPFYTGIMMLEGAIDHAQERAPKMSALLQGGKIMALGKGQNILMGQKEEDEIGFYLSFKADGDWIQESGLDFNDAIQLLTWYQNTYHTWAPLWQELLEAMELPMVPRPIYCMPVDHSWETEPGLTMIGDAAHVMPPFAGEGVNMAMWDALQLSQNLTSGKFDTLTAAFAAFERDMRQRASVMAQESLDNGELMHHTNALESMVGMFSQH